MAEPAARRRVFAVVLAASLAIAALDLAQPLDLRLLDLQFKALRRWAPKQNHRHVTHRNSKT